MQVEGDETEPPDDGDRLTAAEVHALIERGAELQELLGVDEKGLAAVRKRLKRMLQETCPSEMAS
jgi:hypothetical protein